VFFEDALALVVC